MKKINKFFEAGNKKPKQLAIFIHGYGSNGEDLISLASEFSNTLPDAYFVAPNAPMMLPNPFGESYQWFELENRDPNIMNPQIIAANDALDSFIDEQLKRFKLSYKDLILIGFSQGSMMSIYNSLRRKDAVKAVVSFSGRLILPTDLGEKVNSKPRICLIHGDKDEVLPFHYFLEARDSFKKLKIDFEDHEIKGLGHSIDFAAMKKAKEFLKNIC